MTDKFVVSVNCFLPTPSITTYLLVVVVCHANEEAFLSPPPTFVLWWSHLVVELSVVGHDVSQLERILPGVHCADDGREREEEQGEEGREGPAGTTKTT